MTLILIVEDEATILDSLRRGLSYHGYEVDSAANATSAFALAKEHPPDLVVLDLMLPDLDGIEVCHRLKSSGDPGILMLTARDQLPDRVRGLEAGADDYLVKPFSFDELVARIRAILRRRQPREQKLIQIGDLSIDLGAREAFRGSRKIDLTAKEYELLEYLAGSSGRVLKRSTLIEQVWGYQYMGDSDPVKVMINHLRQKLNAEGEPDLIHTVRGYGYVLRAPS